MRRVSAARRRSTTTGGPGGPTGIAVGSDNFPVRWVKTQSFAAGTYTFTVTADDGVRVYLDGALVIDQWKDQPPTTYTASRSVSAGDHVLSVEYYERTSRRGQAGDLAIDAVDAHVTPDQLQALYLVPHRPGARTTAVSTQRRRPAER